MGNNIEIKYSNLSTLAAGFKGANSSLESAYKILGESTDFGSSIMQSFWKFGNKEAVFGAIKSARANIKYQTEENNRLAALMNNIDNIYENAANRVAKHDSYKRILGYLFFLQPVVFTLIVPDVIAGLCMYWSTTNVFKPFLNTWLGGEHGHAPIIPVNTAPSITTFFNNATANAHATVQQISEHLDVSAGQCLNDIWRNWGAESPNGFTNYNGKGNCTWYADHRWLQKNPGNPLVFTRDYNRNAKRWIDAIDQTKFNVNSTADTANIKGNAIAVSQSGTYGHVAYIENVKDGMVYFTEDGEAYTRPHTWQKDSSGNWVGPTVQCCSVEEFKTRFGHVITSK